MKHHHLPSSELMVSFCGMKEKGPKIISEKNLDDERGAKENTIKTVIETLNDSRVSYDGQHIIVESVDGKSRTHLSKHGHSSKKGLIERIEQTLNKNSSPDA